MIKEDFYPTVYTATAGKYTGSARTLANSGEYSPEDFANPYTMGYIPSAEIPLPLVVSNCSVVGEGENAVIQFRRANNGNMLWGLSMSYSSNLGSGWQGAAFYYSSIDNAWNSTNFSSGYASYFINEAEVINYQLKSLYRIDYMSIKHNGDGTWSDNTINAGYNIIKSAEEIRKFIAGEENWTLQIAGQNTLEVTYSMVNSYGMLEYSGGDYTIYFVFRHMYPYGSNNSSCAVSVSNGRGTSMIPFYKFTATKTGTNDDDDVTTCFYATSAPGELGLPFQVNNGVVTPSSHHTFNGMYVGIDDADLPLSEVPGNTSKVYNQFFIFNRNVHPAVSLAEMYKMLCVPNKFYKNPTSSGGVPASDTYDERYTVAQFDKSNRPMWNRLNGSFSSILPKLQIWQYPATDIAENDFDPGNIQPTPGGDTPPDEPQDLPHDEGEPTDDQDDRTLTAPTCFLTQYAMGYSQLQTIGTNLWRSWLTNDTDVWKNFFFAFAQDTGTLDIGAALNFIISLRAFPFNLAGMTTDYISPTDGVYMGTGHTNFCPNASNLFRLNTVIGYLDCGTCEVVPETPYNDFRDMYNCSVLCFLPYCGTVELTPAEVIGRTLHVKYHIDFQSGACTALVKLVGDKGEYTVASKSGQIGFTLPVTATNAGQLSAQFAKDATQTMGTIGGFFFKAGHALADNLNSLTGAFISKPKAINTDGEGNKSLNTFSNNTFETSTKIGEAGFNAGLSLANQALDMLSRSGIDVPAISGGMGAESMMQPDCCFVQIRRGRYAKPVNYPHSQGYINGSSNTISYYRGMFSGTPTYPNSNNKGLCKFTGVDSTGLTCHEDERAEIIALLESGVYL